MTTDDDVRHIRSLLAPADPIDPATLGPDLLALDVRRHPARPRGRELVAAALVGLLVLTAATPFLRPPAAWAVQDVPALGEVVRVESPGLLQRGTDPDEVIDELRRRGVEVDRIERRAWLPWKSGRITGVSWSLQTSDQARGERMGEEFGRLLDGETRPEDLDLAELGLAFHGDGGFSVFPDAFEGGSVTIVVGRLPFLPDDAS